MSHQNNLRAALDIAAAVCVTVASIAVVWSLATNRLNGGVAGIGSSTLTPVQNVENLRLQTQMKQVHGLINTTARLVLVEIADFECPYCRKHALETFPRIKRDLLDTNRLAYAFMNFPLENIHSRALAAAQAAACAEQQGKFWDMHKWLFSTPVNLASENMNAGIRALQIDQHSFERCVQGVTPGLRQEIAELRRLGVTSTPTFLLGERTTEGVIAVKRRIAGAVAYDVIKTAIEEVDRSLSARR
jgi:protein-disulfide isomerase